MTAVSDRPISQQFSKLTGPVTPVYYSQLLMVQDDNANRPDNFSRRKPKSGFDRFKNLLIFIGAGALAFWSAKKFCPSMMKNLGSCLESVGQRLKGVTQEAKTKVEEVAQKTVQAVEETVQKTKETAEKVVEKVKKKTPREEAREKVQETIKNNIAEARQLRLEEQEMKKFLEANPLKAKVNRKVERKKYWRRALERIKNKLWPDKLLEKGIDIAKTAGTGGLA